MKMIQHKRFTKRAAVTTEKNGMLRMASLAAASSVAFVALGGAVAPMAQAAPAAAVTAAATSVSSTLTCLRDAHLHPVLRSGSTGKAVIHLQCQLRAKGHLYVVADGSFGPVTAKAVRAFQSAHGLQVDGIVGAHTWRALG